MLLRNLYPEKVPHIATGQVSGDTGALLVEYMGTYMIPEIKAERLRQDYRPTDMDNYDEWKEDFDRWNNI